jgi:Zn-dependent metalloprotease
MLIARRHMPRMFVKAASLAVLLSGMAGASAQAQTAKPEVADALAAAKRTQPAMNVQIDKRTGLPSRISNINVRTNLVRGLAASSEEPTDEAVKRAVDSFFRRSMLRSAFPQGNPGARRVIRTVKPDPNLPGRRVVEVEQEVNGIPIFGSSAKVSVARSLAVRGLSASFSAAEIPDTTVRIDEAEAIRSARAKLKERLSQTPRRQFGLGTRIETTAVDQMPAKASKTIFDPKLIARGAEDVSDTRLAWLVELDTYKVFVDAKDGQVLYYFRDQRSFVVRSIFDLGGKTTFPGTPVMNEETGLRVAGPSLDAITAFQNSGAVRDFFFAMFGRKSFDDGRSNPDGFGGPIISYVRYGDVPGAFWCAAASQLCPKANVSVYGPGYARALDVMGHEFTHGVIDFEAKLIYADEPGAVNESLADILGTLIELQAREGGGNWKLGEHLPGRSLAVPERDLAEPALLSAEGIKLFRAAEPYDPATNRGQPSHYKDYLSRNDPLCSTTTDYENGCVHFNSGILNKFAYLIANGGSHHAVTVEGIGAMKLGQLTYRTLTTQLNAASSLSDAATGFVIACYELAEAQALRFVEENCRQVERARQAVGLEPATG